MEDIVNITSATHSEPKRDKFQELLSKRLPNCLNDMRLLKNLANTSHYRYRSAEVEQMMDTLVTSLGELEREFQSGLNKQQGR